MTNSESLGAESATEPTTKPESADLNMSAGAEMLIERMKTNPEDFKYGGRFYRVVGALENDQLWVSKRDRRALRDSYETLVTEAEFSEWVYNEIFSPKEEDKSKRVYAQAYQQALHQGQSVMTMNSSGNLGIGAVAPSTVFTASATSAPATMTLGNTTLTESMLGQIKTKLGL